MIWGIPKSKGGIVRTIYRLAYLLLCLVFVSCASSTPQSTDVIKPENTHELKQLEYWDSSVVGDRSASVAFSPTADILAAEYGKELVRLHNIVTGQLLAELDPKLGRINTIAFSPDGKLIAAGGGEYREIYVSEFGVRIWNVATQEQVLFLNDFEDIVHSIAFNPNGATLATGEGNPWGGPGTAKIWDLSTGKLLSKFALSSEMGDPQGDWTIFGVSFNPEGITLVTMSENGQVVFWDVEKQTKYKVVTGVAGMGYGVSFSPDGKLLAVFGSAIHNSDEGSDLRLLDVETGKILVRLEGQEVKENSVAFSSIAFSPIEQVLVSTRWDGTVRLWDVETGKAAADLKVSGASDVAFSPDGTLIAIGGDTVSLWGVPDH
jgi:WD40 repeat protein